SVLASQIVQVSSEAKARPIITAFTMMSAAMNMPHGDRSRGRLSAIAGVPGAATGGVADDAAGVAVSGVEDGVVSDVAAPGAAVSDGAVLGDGAAGVWAVGDGAVTAGVAGTVAAGATGAGMVAA